MERQLVKSLLVGAWIAALAVSARAANPTLKAEHEEFWNGTAAVIVAKVAEIRQMRGAPVGYYEIDLLPEACIAGLLNPARHPTLVADYSLGMERRTIPKPGDLVLVVVIDRTKLGVPRSGFGVANGRCTFMPDNLPLVVLSGSDDPVVLEVLRNMQRARGSTTSPSTRPSGHEDSRTGSG